MAIDKQKELADGLIKAWSDDPIIPDLDKFDEVMSGVMGYEEFKSQLRIYIINLAENLEQGIYELPDEMKTVFVLLGKPGTGKSFISEMLSVATGWYLINIDLGGRKDTEILEGTTPAVKGAFAGRLCQGFATGKQRMPIVLLDEFEKVAGEGLNMMLGNVLDIKKNKNWQDQFLGFEVDISNAIYLATANYADQVPDFVQDRAKFINIPLYTYAQRLKYVMGMLKKKLSKDPLTSKYADQLTENFCKLIITETWGLRQTNMNMSELVKQLRGYAILAKKGKGHAIEDITKYEKLEITPTRFNLKYLHHLRVDFNRVRTVDAEYESDGKTIKGYTWLGNLEEAEWPDFYTTDPTIFKMPPKQTITK